MAKVFQETFGADWLVGCDGTHSRVRKSWTLSLKEGRSPKLASWPTYLCPASRAWDIGAPRSANKEHAHTDGLDRTATEVSVWLHFDGMFLVVPLPGGIRRIRAELYPDDQ